MGTVWRHQPARITEDEANTQVVFFLASLAFLWREGFSLRFLLSRNGANFADFVFAPQLVHML